MTAATSDPGSPASASTEPGSFRDREGRVFYYADEVYRALSSTAFAEWRAVSGTAFFADALETGQVIGTVEADPTLLPDDALEAQRWAGVLHHRKVPFVSYPYEWTFNMLRDAAQLQLQLLRSALNEDFVLKDSSSYNIQWLGHRPVFIDVASFEKLGNGEPWIGYLQFCQLFLYPLMLTAYKDVSFQPLLRGSIDGIEPEVLSSLFSGRDLLRRGVLTHVELQSRLKRSMADRRESVRAEVKKTGFSKQLILNNVSGLQKLLGRLEWKRSRSTWSEYGTGHNYSDQDHRQKDDFVRRAAERSSGALLWDIGANNGRFTRIAAPHFDSAVAMDLDHLAMDRLYLDLKRDSPGNILPLVNNLVDPSPALGWRGLERKTLEERGSPDLTLALALIHHVVIGANVPLAELIDWLSGLGPYLVIEFVSKEDPMTQRLLLNKTDHYEDYELSFFEQVLGRHYQVIERLELGEGNRTLYYCRRHEEPKQR